MLHHNAPIEARISCLKLENSTKNYGNISWKILEFPVESWPAGSIFRL